MVYLILSIKSGHEGGLRFLEYAGTLMKSFKLFKL